MSDAAGILALETHFPSDRLSARSVRNFLLVPSAKVLIAFPYPGARIADPVVAASLILLTRRNSRVARIYSLVVSPAARGQGLGARLVKAAEAAAQEQGCRRIGLEVRQDNAAARGLYTRLGYRQVRHLPNYYDDGADGLRLSKALRE